jgi:hypothetical protein
VASLSRWEEASRAERIQVHVNITRGGTAWNEFSANDRLAHSVRPRQIDYKRRVKGNEPMSLV